MLSSKRFCGLYCDMIKENGGPTAIDALLTT